MDGSSNNECSGDIVFKISDPKGSADSLTVGVIITPVNDPPRLTGLPNINILPGQSDSSIV